MEFGIPHFAFAFPIVHLAPCVCVRPISVPGMPIIRDNHTVPCMNPVLRFALLMLLAVEVAHAQHKPLVITPLTDGFHVYTTYKEYSGTPFPANGMYVVTKAGVVMIDSPWDTTQAKPLLDSIAARHHLPVVLCIATHYHADRTGSFDILNRYGVATYASAHTARLCRKHGEQQPRYQFTSDTSFSVGGVTFNTFFPGAGHTRDNIVVWFPAARVLYGGCFVKSVEAADLGNLADADVARWPASIRAVIRRFAQAQFVIPGHQAWGGTESLRHTLALLTAGTKVAPKGR